MSKNQTTNEERETEIELKWPDLVEGKIRAGVAGELLDAVESDFRRVVEIIDDDDFVSALQKLKRGVTAYVTSSSGH